MGHPFSQLLSRLFHRYRTDLWTPTDRFITGYLLIVAVLLIPFHHEVQQWPVYIFFHFLILIVLAECLRFRFRKPSAAPWLMTAYILYPVAFIFSSWLELQNLITMIFPNYYGTELIFHLEWAIFQSFPTVWIQHYFHPVLTEIMFAVYAAYYILYPTAVGLFFLRFKHKAAQKLIFVLLLNHLSFFIIFLLFPVEGPKTALAAMHTIPHEGCFFYNLVHYLQSGMSIKGAAFPSLHVAESFCITWMSVKKMPRLAGLLLVFSLIISVATVYCQYHYAVDALAGFLFSIPVCLLGSRYYNASVGFKMKMNIQKKETELSRKSLV